MFSGGPWWKMDGQAWHDISKSAHWAVSDALIRLKDVFSGHGVWRVYVGDRLQISILTMSIHEVMVKEQTKLDEPM